MRQAQERGHREYLHGGQEHGSSGRAKAKVLGNLRDGGREGRGEADPGSA